MALAQTAPSEAPTSAATTGNCAALMDAAKQAGEAASKEVDQAKTKADEDTKDDKDKVDACATGYITMEKNHIALDLPEFTMVDQKIIFDLPQVTMKQKHIIFGTPSVECHDVKTGQYPETTCTDTWIITKIPFDGDLKTKGVPACTVTWHDIITTQCQPIITQQDIVMGIPEVTISQTSFVMGIPQVTMKRQDWYFDLPKFNVTSGCIGSGCEQRCNDASQQFTNHYQGIIGPAVEHARTSVAKATTESLQCQRGVAAAQRDTTLATFDANIAVVRGSLAQLQAMGATQQATETSAKLDQLIATREKVAAQFEATIKSIDDSEQKATNSAVSNP
jgi:hypothetical protein